MSVFRPNTVCLCVSLSCVNLHNQQHVLVMCAVAFYMMENYPLDVGPEFNAGIIQVGRGHNLKNFCFAETFTIHNLPV